MTEPVSAPLPPQHVPATGVRGVANSVTSVLVSRGLNGTFSHSLDSLLAQTLVPNRIVVVDVGAEVTTSSTVAAKQATAQAAGTELIHLSAPRARHFGAAIDVAIAQITDADRNTDASGHTWLWVLHDDAAALPDALENLLHAVEHSDSVAVAGAKQVTWDDPDRLISVGYAVSTGGRRLMGIEPHELDQGQHDSREDVLAVSLAGALVRSDVWRQLQGTFDVLAPYYDGLDFCVRAHRAGFRVVVVPQAIVAHAQQTLRTHGSGIAPRLRSWLSYRVASASPIFAPLLMIWFVLVSIPRALYRVAVKMPRYAVDELMAPWWVVMRWPRITAAQVRAARTSKFSRSTLRPLKATSREIWAADRDRQLARSARRKLDRQGNDLERAESRRLSARRRAALGVAVVGLVALTIVVFGPLLSALTNGKNVVGGAMLTASGSWEQWWTAVSSGWNSSGLGSSAPVDGFVTGLAPALVAAGGSQQSAIAALFFASLAAAGFGAWYAAGAFTRSLATRLWAVLIWVSVPATLMASSDGRLGAVLAHAMMPWLALAVARTLGVQRQDEGVRQVDDAGSITALGAASLVMALAVAAAPVLLFPMVLALAVAIFASRRHASRRSRASLLVIPLPTLVMLGPTLWRAVVTWNGGGWRILVADPGGAMPFDPASPWEFLLGHSAVARTWSGWFGVVEPVVPYALGGLLVIAALAGAFRAGSRGRMARIGWLLVPIGIITATISAHTTVTITAGERVTGWTGAGVSLAFLGLSIAALAGIDGSGRAAAAHPLGWRQGLVAGLAIVCAVVPLTTAINSIGQLKQNSPLALRSTVVVPSVGRFMQESDRRVRVLVLEERDNGIAYQLMRHDGMQWADSSAVVKVDKLRSQSDPVTVSVAQLVAGEPTGVAQQLQHFGIGAVLLPQGNGPKNGVEFSLVERMDTVPGLQRITEGTSSLVWRVVTESTTSSADGTAEDIQSAWARVVSPADEAASVPQTTQVLRAEGLTVKDRVKPGPDNRLLLVAETAAPGWHATVGGVELATVPTDDGLLAFNLGGRSGALTVSYERASQVPWLVLQGAVLLVFTLLALPVRRRRGGGR